MAKTLQTKRPYVLPGTYVAEDVQPGSVNVAPDTRIPTFIGKGSANRLVRNSTLVRGYVYDTPLTFSFSSPWTAVLPVASIGNKDTAVLVDSTGLEVLKDQWYFGADKTTVIVSDAAYNPASAYLLSYQGNDVNIPDAIPEADLRLLNTIGSQLDQNQYKRNIDFYLDVATDAPAPAVDADGDVVQHTNAQSSFSGVAHVGTGLGDIALDTYAVFEHKYNRAYALTVTAVTGTAVTFSWTATPVSAGNGSLPSVPLTAGVAAPSFVVDSAVAQSLQATLELGIRVNFSFTAGAFVVGDVYSFTAYGPSILENASSQLNTNQYAIATAVVPALDNDNTGSLTADASLYSGSQNLAVKAVVTAVDSGAVAGTLPTGSVTFASAPVDGATIVIDNGRAGAAHVVKTFEFDTDSVQTTPGSTLIVETIIPAIPAVGSVTATGIATDVPVDGTTVTIADGVRTVVFEYDSDNTLVNPGATRVVVGTTVGSESAETAANLALAIASSTLRITPVDASAANAGVGKVNLTAQVPGVLGNAAIIVSGTGVTATGMAGGVDAISDLTATIGDFAAAVRAASAQTGITAQIDGSNPSKVNLLHGARLVATTNPAEGTTFAVTLDGVSTTYKFTATPVAATDIQLGGSVGATIAAAAAALAGPALATASVGGVLTVAPVTARNVTLSSALTVIPSVIDDANSTNNGNVAITGTSTAGITLAGFSGGADAAVSPDRVTVAWGTSGDEFTSGITVLEDGVKNTIFRNIRLGLSKSAAAPARATINLNVNPADGNTVTIPDGILPIAVTFEFDNNATVVSGHTAVAIGANAAATAANLAAKITTSGLQVQAVVSGASLAITHKKNGAGPANAYNSPITAVGAAISVVGFAGGAANYSVGDTFTFSALAPRQISLALDDRITNLTVTQVGSLTDPTVVGFAYEANTPEGGFGELVANAAGVGYVTLPGQIQLAVRNLNRFVSGDRFTVEHVNNGKILWNLNAKSTQTFSPSDVHTDRNGSVTGRYGALYITLGNVPLAGTLALTLGGVAFTAYRQIQNSTVLVLDITDVTVLAPGLAVAYTFAGNEPGLGTTYYISGQYKRPDAYYNIPFIFYDLPSALAFLAPVTADNDLAIAAMLAFDQDQAPLAIAVLQVQDADDDGVFSDADIDAAIRGAGDVFYITDLVPLRLQKYLSKFLTFNVRSSDPFEKRMFEFYHGAAAGTPIGDADTDGSMVATAKNTLQVFGPSYAHGTRIMVAPRVAKKTITLSDNTVTQVTLDGSFVAAATASCVAGSPTYSQTLLKTTLRGFDYVETFGNSQNLVLGAAGLIFFGDSGAGVYTFEEDQTVDTYAAEFHEILPMRQKQDVVRIVRREMDASVIGMVPNTQGDATATIASKLMQVLIGLVNTGVLPPYQDDAGNARQINSSDVDVFVDENDPTKYNFLFGFYTRFAIKRLFGLYVTNKSVKG